MSMECYILNLKFRKASNENNGDNDDDVCDDNDAGI